MQNEIKKDVPVNFRLSKDLHDKIIKEAISLSSKEGRLVTASEIIRKLIEDKFKKK